MKRLWGILGLAACLTGGCVQAGGNEDFHPAEAVSTLVGTASSFELSAGNTYPAVAVPWGMNFWTPQTGRNGDGWIYTYDAHRIRGLKQTHQPSPWINDYGQFSLMPVTNGRRFDEEGRASWFSHKAETAKPYYYSVYLADHDVLAEMTATSRAAAFRLTYPEREESFLVVDAFDRGSYVRIIPEERKIIGYTTRNSGGVPENFRNWFVLISDTPFTLAGTADGGTADSVSGTTAAAGETGHRLELKADHALAVVGFRTVRGQRIHFKAASSFISAAQAERNLNEVRDKDFDTITSEARDEWNRILGRIEVEDDDTEHIRTFYSALYRSVLFPRSLYEIDATGAPVHYSPFNGKVCAGYLFTDTGFWDTFRSLFPLLNLVYPETAARMQAGLVNDWLESGFLPEWASPGHRDCMVGNNSASVVADAYLKGLRGYDIGCLWEAVTSGAHRVHPHIGSTGRLGWQYYDSLGYVPRDAGIRESAARTLEYAYDDWCILQLGRALGKSETELAPYARGALNYRRLFDRRHGLMVGRNRDGSFDPEFNPLKWGGDFTEGNSLHYTWSVFHDPAGLAALMGGNGPYVAALDRIFDLPPLFDDSYYGFPIHEIREMQVMNMGNYAHGNQPVQHLAYLYDWSDQPWKGQARIREVMEKLYSAAPDGYCGDEDNGQTSAWYVFSALGFYPVCPGSPQYALGTPLFRKATLRLPGGKTFTIRAPGNGRTRFYVDALRLNGRKWDRNYLTHEAVTAGGDLVFAMSDRPNPERGARPEARPYSFSEETRAASASGAAGGLHGK